MHAIKHWLPLSTFALLAGCFDNNIDTVRETRFDMEPSFTIGQALDNRPLCQSHTWDEVQDSKSRTVVEYRCEIKGAREYFEKQFVSLSEKLNSRFYTKESSVEAELKSAQDAVTSSEEDIADYQQTETEDEGTQASARIVELRSAIAALQSGDPADLANVQLPAGYRIVEYYSDNVNDAEAGLKEAVAETLTGMQEELQRETESEQQYAQEMAEQASQGLQYANDSLKQARERLNELQSKRDEALAQVAAEREAAMAKLKGYTDVETAHEIYQWTVSKDKDVYLSYIGVEIDYANGEQEDRSDPHGASRHLRAVLNDAFDTYEKYVRAGLPGGGIKRDPELLWLIY
ncbi:hypothetical protein F3I16_19695 [Pseudomonas sp. L-22-4S-12]|uniref:hypothetical protein n=1 Tax=Pseudomonas sp. L-22-4S-12 TaxID=2610893 RepID=UPI0013278764|nr:hypothetical protein [Pseudomonas sp. L-22-4S-12]MWV18269.1 hypothetical protein [Pseudomonas sp. L-22-4S-12]